MGRQANRKWRKRAELIVWARRSKMPSVQSKAKVLEARFACPRLQREIAAASQR